MLTDTDALKARMEAARGRAARARTEADRLARALSESDRRLRAQRLMAVGAIAFRLAEVDGDFRRIILTEIERAGLRETDRKALAGTVFGEVSDHASE